MDRTHADANPVNDNRTRPGSCAPLRKRSPGSIKHLMRVAPFNSFKSLEAARDGSCLNAAFTPHAPNKGMMTRPVLTLLLAVAAGLSAASPPARGQACEGFSGLPVPRFVSLRYDEAIGRSGPSRQHPELYVYRRAGLPLEIVQETPDWRKVRDPDGVEVWMHRRLLSGRRAVWALEAADLRARPEGEASLIARIEPGARLWLERCRTDWCRLEADGRRGWAPAASLWGVTASDRGADGALEGSLPPCYRSDPEQAGPADAQ